MEVVILKNNIISKILLSTFVVPSLMLTAAPIRAVQSNVKLEKIFLANVALYAPDSIKKDLALVSKNVQQALIMIRRAEGKNFFGVEEH